jgi:hypothetical protein
MREPGSAVGFAGGLYFIRRGAQAALMAWISGCTPRMAIIRFQIVGENVKAHLRADLFEGAQPELGGAQRATRRARCLRQPQDRVTEFAGPRER